MFRRSVRIAPCGSRSARTRSTATLVAPTKCATSSWLSSSIFASKPTPSPFRSTIGLRHERSTSAARRGQGSLPQRHTRRHA